MPEDVSIELYLGVKGGANDKMLYLPADSEAIGLFLEPLTLSIKGVIQSGQPPADVRAKIFWGEPPRWQDPAPLVEAFAGLWVDVVQSQGELSGGTTGLVYFSGEATHDELFSLWPYLPFGIQDKKRFFVSTMCRDSSRPQPAWGWVCVEYSYRPFKQLARTDAFSYMYGSYVMGIWVRDAQADAHLAVNPLDKNVLEQALKNEAVRGWWFFDSDFEGMTLWHKDVPGEALLRHLKARNLELLRGQHGL
jgi:hypothetical protein